LRLKTYSIAWRQAQNDTVLTAKSGKKYLLPKGMLIGLHFAMRHLHPQVHPDPLVFRPERFLGTGAGLSPTINGHKYAWVPFSAGRHKCSGYSLAMLEIPVIMALAMRKYDLQIVDPLPGMDFKQAFGVVGPDAQPVRIRYSLRK
jgi:cytochrome P450